MKSFMTEMYYSDVRPAVSGCFILFKFTAARSVDVTRSASFRHDRRRKTLIPNPSEQPLGPDNRIRTSQGH